MALIPRPEIDYTDKDFDSILARLYSLIEVVFPDWTSQQVADFGNILIQLYAFVGDVLGFYLDAHPREAHIATATQRRSLLALSKLLNYTPSSATAATVECDITLDAVPANDVEFDAGTLARTLAVTDPIDFQLLADATILASTDPPTVAATFENSTPHTETFPSSGVGNQEIVLGETPFLDDKETISAANGSYSKVSNFLDSTPTDRDYMVIVDQNDRATIRFGNGVNGELPTGDITVSYRTGGGSSGNVEAGAIRKLVGNFTDVLGNPVRATITNSLAATGGGPRETIEQIRAEAPASLRVLNRTVSREDYEINARRVAGVQRALMLTSNEDSRVAENAGNLYIVPTGGGTASQSLLDDVETMVTETYPNTLTFDVSVVAAPYLIVNIQATVFFSPGNTPATVKAAIEDSLAEYFALVTADGEDNELVGFGYDYAARGVGVDEAIPLSDLRNAVRDTTGVYKISDASGSFLVNLVEADLAIPVDHFPVLGTVTIIDGSTGTEVS